MIEKPTNKYYMFSKGGHQNFLSLFMFKEGGLKLYANTIHKPSPTTVKAQKLGLYYMEYGEYLFELIEQESPYYIQMQYTFEKFSILYGK